ncbi:WD repeat protein [Aspergillus luchuensis]|uniref:WD repeat protein n=1 Tax=Aspergillus kawachii TaxID=1069201 RepID=A0A146FS63_ASPKA|nr:WD repeat protein [Aspergillus luchuensis]
MENLCCCCFRHSEPPRLNNRPYDPTLSHIWDRSSSGVWREEEEEVLEPGEGLIL